MTATPGDDQLPPFDAPALASTWLLETVCWKVLDPETATREWPTMAEWVRWLANRYVLSPRTIPPCWYHHGGMLEELSALRTGWLAAFAPDAAGSAPLDWHAAFAATRGRLEETVSRSGCTKDDHRVDHTASWLARPDPDFAAAFEADLANRAHRPAPPASD
jgi:hypothetical protein